MGGGINDIGGRKPSFLVGDDKARGAKIIKNVVLFVFIKRENVMQGLLEGQTTLPKGRRHDGIISIKKPRRKPL